MTTEILRKKLGLNGKPLEGVFEKLTINETAGIDVDGKETLVPVITTKQDITIESEKRYLEILEKQKKMAMDRIAKLESL